MKTKKRNKLGWTILRPGEVPKPQRIKGYIKGVFRLHKEIISARRITFQIMQKDVRTVKSYYEALALAKLALVDLKEVINKLEMALHGQKEEN